MKAGDAFFLGLILAILSFSLGGGTGDAIRARAFRNEAVEVGHAEYYLDANHNKQWRWLPKQ